MQEVLDVLRQSQQSPNQTEFRKIITNELDYSDSEARKLIKKGDGIYWEKTRKKEGKGNRAFSYVVMSAIYIPDKSTYENQSSKFPDITDTEKQAKTLDNNHLLICQDNAQHINKSNKFEPVEIIKIPSIKIGRRVLFDLQDIDQFYAV